MPRPVECAASACPRLCRRCERKPTEFWTRGIPLRCIRLLIWLVIVISFACTPAVAHGQRSTANAKGEVSSNAPPISQHPVDQAAEAGLQLPESIDVNQMLSPGGLTSTLKVMLLLTVLSLAPSILIMTTCFIRFVIVLGLLRQALGTQQLPPNQVLVSLCLFLTFLVMAPVWTEAYEHGI